MEKLCVTLWYQFIGGSVPEAVTARENSPMVHLCGRWMSYRYFTVLFLLLYFYCVYGDIFITHVMNILLNILNSSMYSLL